LRRGRPTCHKAFDEATAILVGTRCWPWRLRPWRATCIPRPWPQNAARSWRGRPAPVSWSEDRPTIWPAWLPTPESRRSSRSIAARPGPCFLASLELGARIGGGDGRQRAAPGCLRPEAGIGFSDYRRSARRGGLDRSVGQTGRQGFGAGETDVSGVLGADESRRRAEQLIDEACQALAPLAPRAEGLDVLARYVLERNH